MTSNQDNNIIFNAPTNFIRTSDTTVINKNNISKIIDMCKFYDSENDKCYDY